MKILINYGNEEYKETQELNSKTGMSVGGFDKVFSFGPNDIESAFKREYANILEIKRGNGLWLWKPYFINKVLNECDDGDYIFYCDSGAYFKKNIDEIISSLREGEKIWVSDNPLIESCFTKPLCFEKMDCKCKEYMETNQIQATYMMFINGIESRKFVNEWLNLCEDYELITPENNMYNIDQHNKIQFIAHREDQSIFSLLCKKRGIKPHKDPSQRGRYPITFYNPVYAYKVSEHPEDKYDTVIFLHKAKVPSKIVYLKQMLRMCKQLFIYIKNREMSK